MRGIIQQTMGHVANIYDRPLKELLSFSWHGLDAGGFGFTYKGGARAFTIRFEAPVDLDRFASELVSIWGNVIGEYRKAPACMAGGYIMAYWNETWEPVLFLIDRQSVSLFVNRDHSDLQVYSFLADLRRYVDPCARLEKLKRAEVTLNA